MTSTISSRCGVLAVLAALLVGAACRAPDSGAALLWVFDYSRGFGASSVAVGPDARLYFTGKDSIIKLGPDSVQSGGFALGSVLASAPSIGADGTIYVVRADSVDLLNAYSPTGARKWVYRLFGGSHGVFDPPAIGADGTLYLLSAAGDSVSYLCAVNPDGTEKWHCAIPEGWCVMPPSIAADGTIYLASNTALYAVSPAGQLKWTANVDVLAWTSPAIATDGTVYLATTGGCCAITTEGYLKWELSTDSITGAQGPVALGSDGTIYLPDGAACAAGPDSVKWHCKLSATSHQTPVVGGDGTVYFCERTGSTALARQDAFCAVSSAGKLLWRHSLGEAVIHGVTRSSDGKIYVATSVGICAFKDEGTQTGQWPMYMHDARHTGRSGAF